MQQAARSAILLLRVRAEQPVGPQLITHMSLPGIRPPVFLRLTHFGIPRLLCRHSVGNGN